MLNNTISSIDTSSSEGVIKDLLGDNTFKWGSVLGQGADLIINRPYAIAYTGYYATGTERSTHSDVNISAASAFESAAEAWAAVADVTFTLSSNRFSLSDINLAGSSYATQRPVDSTDHTSNPFWSLIYGTHVDIWANNNLASGIAYNQGDDGYFHLIQQLGFSLGLDNIGNQYDSTLTVMSNNDAHNMIVDNIFTGTYHFVTPSSPTPPTRRSLPAPPISTSLPSLPSRVSSPALPVRTLRKALPIRRSLPLPPMAFSISTLKAMPRLLLPSYR